MEGADERGGVGWGGLTDREVEVWSFQRPLVPPEAAMRQRWRFRDSEPELFPGH